MPVQSFYKKHAIPVTLLLVIGSAILLSVIIVSVRTQSYQELVEAQIVNQQSVLQGMATAVAQNRADSAAGLLIQDCPQSQRLVFDELLGQLDAGLERSELQTLDQLFAGCANVRAERKSVAVMQFARELAALESLVSQLDVLTMTSTDQKYATASWEDLLGYEMSVSQGLNNLVQAQREIIDALLEGKLADSAEIVAILSSVNETRQSLIQANQQAATLRDELMVL